MDNAPLLNNNNQQAVNINATNILNAAVERDNDAKDWLGVAGVMLITYAYVVVLFTISIQGVFASYQGWLGAILGVFVLYVATIAYLWVRGLKKAEDLSRQMIEEKLKQEEGR